MRPRLDAIATLLDQGAADSAVRLLRSGWDPELPAEELVPMYCLWIRGLCDSDELHTALTLARRAATEFPREPDILTALGNVHDLRGELEPAREAFELAAHLDTRSNLAAYNLGAVLERLGYEQEAEAQYQRAIELDSSSPGMVEAHAALGALYRRQGRMVEAEAVYDAYLEEDALEVEILVEHGICLSDLGRLEEAVSRFESAIGLASNHGSAWYNLAITYFRMGKTEKARETMRQAHNADPRNPLTLAVLGAWTLADPEGGELDEGLRHVYRALDLTAEQTRRGELGPGYASLVAEEVFESLWQGDRRAEAREVARRAARLGWVTPHMLDTLNRSDRDAAPAATTYRVEVRALLEEEGDATPDWPADASGYTTGLCVVAQDEAEARELAEAWLRELDPAARLRLDIEVVSRAGASEGPLARGVARIESGRAYFGLREG